jgi:hypothetical protein
VEDLGREDLGSERLRVTDPAIAEAVRRELARCGGSARLTLSGQQLRARTLGELIGNPLVDASRIDRPSRGPCCRGALRAALLQ